MLVGVALIIVFQFIFIIVIQQPILKFPVDGAILAHVDNVILIVLIILPVPVLNHLILFKAGALAMTALVGGVRLARVSQLCIAGLFCGPDSAPRFPPDDHSCPEQKRQHNRGGDEQGCPGALTCRFNLTCSKDTLICWKMTPKEEGRGEGWQRRNGMEKISF